jgi:hypothetical protein
VSTMDKPKEPPRRANSIDTCSTGNSAGIKSSRARRIASMKEASSSSSRRNSSSFLKKLNSESRNRPEEKAVKDPSWYPYTSFMKSQETRIKSPLMTKLQQRVQAADEAINLLKSHSSPAEKSQITSCETEETTLYSDSVEEGRDDVGEGDSMRQENRIPPRESPRANHQIDRGSSSSDKPLALQRSSPHSKTEANESPTLDSGEEDEQGQRTTEAEDKIIKLYGELSEMDHKLAVTEEQSRKERTLRIEAEQKMIRFFSMEKQLQEERELRQAAEAKLVDMVDKMADIDHSLASSEEERQKELEEKSGKNSEIKELKKKINALESRLTKTEKQLSNEKAEHQSSKSCISMLRTMIEEKEKEISTRERQLKANDEKHLKESSVFKTTDHQIQTMENRLQDKDKQIEKLRDENKTLAMSLQTQSAQNKTLMSSVEKTRDLYKKESKQRMDAENLLRKLRIGLGSRSSSQRSTSPASEASRLPETDAGETCISSAGKEDPNSASSEARPSPKERMKIVSRSGSRVSFLLVARPSQKNASTSSLPRPPRTLCPSTDIQGSHKTAPMPSSLPEPNVKNKLSDTFASIRKRSLLLPGSQKLESKNFESGQLKQANPDCYDKKASSNGVARKFKQSATGQPERSEDEPMSVQQKDSEKCIQICGKEQQTEPDVLNRRQSVDAGTYGDQQYESKSNDKRKAPLQRSSDEKQIAGHRKAGLSKEGGNKASVEINIDKTGNAQDHAENTATRNANDSHSIQSHEESSTTCVPHHIQEMYQTVGFYRDRELDLHLPVMCIDPLSMPSCPAKDEVLSSPSDLIGLYIYGQLDARSAFKSAKWHRMIPYKTGVKKGLHILPQGISNKVKQNASLLGHEKALYKGLEEIREAITKSSVERICPFQQSSTPESNAGSQPSTTKAAKRSGQQNGQAVVDQEDDSQSQPSAGNTSQQNSKCPEAQPSVSENSSHSQDDATGALYMKNTSVRRGRMARYMKQVHSVDSSGQQNTKPESKGNLEGEESAITHESEARRNHSNHASHIDSEQQSSQRENSFLSERSTELNPETKSTMKNATVVTQIISEQKGPFSSFPCTFAITQDTVRGVSEALNLNFKLEGKQKAETPATEEKSKNMKEEEKAVPDYVLAQTGSDGMSELANEDENSDIVSEAEEAKFKRILKEVLGSDYEISLKKANPTSGGVDSESANIEPKKATVKKAKIQPQESPDSSVHVKVEHCESRQSLANFPSDEL